MFRRLLPLLLAAFGLHCLLTSHPVAHDGLELEPPISEEDAWNMLRLCQANLTTLAGSGQWSEMPIQSSLSIQALRYLREHLPPPRQATLLLPLLEAEEKARLIFQAAEQEDGDRTPRELREYVTQLAAIGREYPPAVRDATIYACPMCRGIREREKTTPCFKCGMDLVPRVIPASTLYEMPGEPSISVEPKLAGPVTPGQPCSLSVTLRRKKDGQPVTQADLLVVHTERIHLLIIDATLRDYHHEHPVPTGRPGEYQCSFTPRTAGPYRLFADVVPALSNVQEYATADLAGANPVPAVQKGPPSEEAELDGFRFQIQWEGAVQPLRPRHPVRATVSVTGPDGKPFTGLEPIMGTFAHLVAFHEDRKTVLHIHPLGGGPTEAQPRGGPQFTFQFYPPQSGYYRLYAQVQIGGRSRFAPFDLHVRPE